MCPTKYDDVTHRRNDEFVLSRTAIAARVLFRVVVYYGYMREFSISKRLAAGRQGELQTFVKAVIERRSSTNQ